MNGGPTPTAKNQQSVPRAIGQTLATIQHLLDLALDWGFRKLRKVGEKPLPQAKGHGVFAFVKKSAVVTAKFLGSAGESYYEWYEKLKAERGQRK